MRADIGAYVYGRELRAGHAAARRRHVNQRVEAGEMALLECALAQNGRADIIAGQKEETPARAFPLQPRENAEPAWPRRSQTTEAADLCASCIRPPE